MPFQQFLSAEEQAEIRQAIGDVASGTFGQHDITFITKITTPGDYGESPVESDVSYPLKGLMLSPDAVRKEDESRAQIDWDLRVMFSRDYLAEEGVYDLMKPDTAKRNHEYIVDNLRYRVKRYNWEAQFVDDYLIVFVDLERM